MLATSIVAALANQLHATMDMESGPGGTKVSFVHMASPTAKTA
ncbi:MAG: hypothetical protein AAB734_01035 [Patescibacteria group bacterium]